MKLHPFFQANDDEETAETQSASEDLNHPDHPFQKAFQKASDLFETSHNEITFSSKENDCFRSLRRWRNVNFDLGIAPRKYDELVYFMEFTLSLESFERLFSMNHLTLWVVERGIVTQLNIFNHHYARFGWIMLVHFFHSQKQRETVGFWQYFEMMEHIIEFVYERSRRSMNSPIKEKLCPGFCTIEILFPELVESLNLMSISDDKMDGLRVLFIVTYFAMKDLKPPGNNGKSKKVNSDIDKFIRLVTKKWPEALTIFLLLDVRIR